MMRLWSCLWIVGIAVLALPGARAQQGGAAFDWIARTSEAAPNPGLDLAALFKPRAAALRQIGVDRDLVKVSDLSNGRWVTVRAVRHQMPGRYVPRVAPSFDEQAAYLWNFDGELRIFHLNELESPAHLFSLQDPRLRQLMYAQSAGRVSGDAAHGFWVTNNFVGSAVFIEPGTWAIREVSGLTLPPGGRSPQPAFRAAALGAEGSLWVIEPGSRDIVRRDPRGEELARVPWPFATDVPAGVSLYGDGALEPSKAGVLAISNTRLELASVYNAGQILWRLAVCRSGIGARCAQEASQRGQLSTIQRAVADEAGHAWIADNNRSLFFHRGTGDPQRLFGNLPPCLPEGSPASAGKQQNPPCVGANDRLVQLADGRYLIYTRTGGFSARHVMQIELGQPSRISFESLKSDAADLPRADRQAVLQSLADLRVWGFSERQSGLAERSDSTGMGVPTGRGVATASKMMSKYLSPPGDAIRTPEDAALAKLFEPTRPFDPGSHSMARFGEDAVVIKDRRVPPTQLALYDMRTGELRQGIEVRGLQAPAGCGQEHTALEYVFNDNVDTLYLMREWSGEVFVIDSTFTATRLARLPHANADRSTACGAVVDAGARVPLAARTPGGNLVIATANGVFVQRGETFDRIEAPASVVQLVVLSDAEALAIAKEGLARLRLPK
ncbi:MAG TPA: hypothetical protein PKM73_21520 [Verrucomicrobiota bacterium]|nr:hypothetical protein [Verrucomicrobiota bacterium]